MYFFSVTWYGQSGFRLAPGYAIAKKMAATIEEAFGPTRQLSTPIASIGGKSLCP
jgi:hypothetical protein